MKSFFNYILRFEKKKRKSFTIEEFYTEVEKIAKEHGQEYCSVRVELDTHNGIGLTGYINPAVSVSSGGMASMINGDNKKASIEDVLEGLRNHYLQVERKEEIIEEILILE
jgi:hypothetical protein